MYDTMLSIASYISKQEFANEFKVALEYSSLAPKSITVHAIYNNTSTEVFGGEQSHEYIVQLDVSTRHRIDCYRASSAILYHFAISRNIALFKYNNDGSEIGGNECGFLLVNDTVHSFKDFYEEAGFQRMTIRYLATAYISNY